MKKIFLSLIGLGLLGFIVCQVNSAPFVYDNEITLSSSTASIIALPRIRRNYFLAVNTGSSYDLKIATYSLTATDKGLTLFTTGGAWEEVYNCYQSTWYAIAINGATTISVREKE